MNGYSVMMKGINGNIFGKLMFANSKKEIISEINNDKNCEILSISKIERFSK